MDTPGPGQSQVTSVSDSLLGGSDLIKLNVLLSVVCQSLESFAALLTVLLK